MSTEHKGDMIRDIPDLDKKKMLKNTHEGELLVSEGPKGEKLWKKKKKLNEKSGGVKTLNE